MWIITTTTLTLVFIFSYPLIFQQWYTFKTKGDRYFSLPLAARHAFRKTLKYHAIVLLPYYRFLAKGVSKKHIPSIKFNNICFPSAITNIDSINNACHYQPTNDDIFVATFMKSGTTWMQNIVFELLHHGQGNLSDTGYKHMYALSPWIETSPLASVSMENAPFISRYKKRIIKTHLPAALCPFNNKAKYIYVVRHPENVLASCENFFKLLMGPFCPSQTGLLDLFCSEKMLWGPWPAHVSDWKQLSQKHDNILFVRYEDMQNDNINVLKTIAKFLKLDLTDSEIIQVAEKSSFAAMKTREDYFDMSPPNIFSVSTELNFLQIKHADKNTSEHINKNNRKAIQEFCHQAMHDNNYKISL